MTSASSAPPKLPSEFFDSHHHFLDTGCNSFQGFLGSLVPNEKYLPRDYLKDVVEPLRAAGVCVTGSTHLECMPDDGREEVAWVHSVAPPPPPPGQPSTSTVRAIVASTDLTLPTVDEDLAQLVAASPRVRGIRWILDCVGPFDGGRTATHVATTRHDGVDYLRGSNGGYDGDAVPSFERGIALLGKHGLSFDLQCAPEQLVAAAALFSRHPGVPVAIDHLGKPRLLGPHGASATEETDDKELEVWRAGMKAMAALPHAHVKISMLGYSVPDWDRVDSRREIVKGLVRETVELFGPERCMVATNFWKNAAVSDTDGRSPEGPDPVRLLEVLRGFLADYPAEALQAIFSGTAQKFYRIN